MSRTHNRRTTRRLSRLHIERLECRDLPAFVTPPVYPAGTNPTAMVAGDFNGDGLQDVVVTNQTTPGTVTLLLNTGGGTLGTPRSFPAGGLSTNSVATADFNGDGRLDLAVTNSITGTVSILRGSGTGLFRRPISYAAGPSPTSVTVADFNGDSILDLAVANQVAAGKITVLLGTGGGVFQPGVIYAAGHTPRSIAVADFDNDGVQDLAVANSGDGTVGVLLGQGDGTFGPMMADGVIGGNPYDLAVGDVNADGAQDIVTAHHTVPGAVSVLPGNGDGTFQIPRYYTAGDMAGVALLADITGDGVLDIVTGNQGWAAVSINTGAGDGTFPFVRHFVTGQGANGIVAADLSGDGQIDFAVTHADGSGVAVMIAENDIYPASVSNSALYIHAVADFDADGTQDLVNVSSAAATVWLGSGDGVFPTTKITITGWPFYPFAATAADFNGDNRVDLAVASHSPGNRGLELMLGNGDGTFQAPVYYPGSSDDPRDAELGDFNGDGKLDVVLADQNNATLTVYLGNGNGTFQSAAGYGTDGGCWSVAMGDFNGDNRQDLTCGDSILLGNGDGTFQPKVTFSNPYGTRDIEVADFNGDGKQDLVSTGGSEVGILLGNGNGTFQDFAAYVIGYSKSVEVTDFNDDGIEDLALTIEKANAASNEVAVLLGNADGTFQPALHFLGGAGANSLNVADFTGDGLPDVVTSGPYLQQGFYFTLLTNAGDWGTAPIGGGSGVYDALVSMKTPTKSTMLETDDAPAQLRELKAPVISDGATDSMAKSTSPRILARISLATHVFAWASPDDWLASAFGVGE